MAQPAPANTDRLPWLTEVPRMPPRAEKKARKAFPWEWLVAALLVLAVGAAAWWLGTRGDDEPQTAAPVQEGPATQRAPGDELIEIPSVSDMTETAQLPPEPAPQAEEQSPEPSPRAEAPARRQRSRPAQDSSPAEAKDSTPTPQIAIPAQPVVRGRIIQIGAYPTRAEADVAWQYVVKRWPYLASKPKLVSPIEVRSTDGKATRMYRLQMATASQAQSAVICQRLETSKVSCVVVY